MTVDCSALNNIYAIPRPKEHCGWDCHHLGGKTQQSQTHIILGYQNWACEQSGTGARGPAPYRSTTGYGQILEDGELFPLVVYQLVVKRLQ